MEGENPTSSKHKFSKARYSLLYKNLNFLPTETNSSIKNFNQDIENFYLRIKLTAHFGTNISNEIQNEEDIFKHPQNKNWLPKHTHDTIQIFH